MKPIFDGTKWDGQIYNAKDALAERPETEYVIEGIFPKASLSVVYGLPASHKTNIVIDAVICNALNKNWLMDDGFKGFVVKKCPSLWIDADSGTDLLHERFGAALRAHSQNQKEQEAAPIHYASFLDPAFIANDDASVNELIRRARELNVGIIVFDNLGTISGGVDENSPFMIAIMHRLRTIATRTNAAVIVIHHIVKSATNGKSRKSPRGHGSIEAAVDSAFYLESDDNSVSIHQTKARRKRIGDFGALFECEHKPNGIDLLKMRFIGVEPKLPDVYIKARKALIDYLKTQKEANQSALVQILFDKNKVANNKARAILSTFETCGLLSVRTSQHKNQKLFQIKDINAHITLF